MLVELGADIEAKNVAGATPLRFAAGLGQVAAMKVLVELGADIDAQKDRCETPLQISLRRGHHAAAQVLKALQRPIRTKKNAVTKVPTQQEIDDAAECMAALLEEEEEEEEREKAATAAKTKVRSRPAFLSPALSVVAPQAAW